MDRSLASAPQRALDDAFHVMIARSRAEPAPDLALRLDRLARLRAVVADNEERFRQAISADFGHRSAVETTIAEIMMLYGEVRHASKHLKTWMAPQRIATALQFLPARNRLLPQPLGVIGILAPWNYPLQLTLAPAIGALAAGNRVLIKPSELSPHLSALLKETVARPDDPNWKAHRKFPPTLILGATAEMAVMQEEIFGPLLPLVGVADPDATIAFVNGRDRPLALYWFGKDRAARDEVLARTVSGGVTINDCLFHFAQVNQPMGGVGASGTGAYHGEWGFRTFSKLKPVFYRSRFNRLADLYPPYGGKIARLEKMMRFMS